MPMDMTDAESLAWRERRNEDIVDIATPGDHVELSRYLDRVAVVDKTVAEGHVELLVRSTNGETVYRLRTVEDDDRLLLEKPKPDGEGWERHLWVHAVGPFVDAGART